MASFGPQRHRKQTKRTSLIATRSFTSQMFLVVTTFSSLENEA